MHSKQYVTMQSSPLIYHSWTSVSSCQTLRDFMKCFMFTTHLEFVPHPGIFIQNLRLWDRGIFVSFYMKAREMDFRWSVLSKYTYFSTHYTFYF
jgi:hypothetical protein